MKIASVPYFNAKPLIEGLGGVELHHPRVLARKLRGGEVDVGLVPVVEALECPERYDILDGFSISSRGHVKSVFLAHRGRLEDIRVVAVDVNSKTSATLVRVVCEKFLGFFPRYEPFTPGEQEQDQEAVMLIGDQALRFLRQPDRCQWEVIDLGGMWKEKTGLPFVYAVWAARKGIADFALFEKLRRAKETGLARIAAICAGSHEFGTTEEAVDYLTHHIFYDMGPEEKAGVEEFRAMLQEKGILGNLCPVNYLNFD
ncbi:menaquinone biosynthesis protein [Kamptonema cortianum]|nr:menaquinone biosynthesis protein [Oscillatoria laete-virens]MDK3159616.1 menaquinone biosynthesis protein [Kamptonema cortianum]MDL5050264.1 menaquinone biosynthesis protein [Oscillatoria amoena NRMC-F 0135]MDL5055100.1 menaquinone biosynthesis protein [Oscillatoria laete-virens NRMC-F 0139]